MIAYVCVTLNYNRAYQTKEGVLTVIEEYQGLNAKYSVKKIAQILKAHGTISASSCQRVIPDGKAVGITKEGVVHTGNAAKNQAHSVCIKRELQKNSVSHGSGSSQKMYDDYYYTVFLFFNFNIPIFGDIFMFNVSGQTNAIYYLMDDYESSW